MTGRACVYMYILYIYIYIYIAKTNIIVHYVIKDDMERYRHHRTKQNAKYLRRRQSPLPSKFLATANQQKNQLRYYKDILLTENRCKIS